MIKIAFLVHGKTPHCNRRVSEIQAVFGDKNDCECQVTTRAGHFTELAYESIRNGTSHIICVGGDGSLNETANGFMQARNDATLASLNWKNIRLGLLPAGTGNDFARTAKVNNDLGLLKNYIDNDRFRQFDLGLVDLVAISGEQTRRYFINILDVGIGGVISQKLANSPKRWGPTITYQSAVIRGLLTYKNQPVEIKADTFDYRGRIMSFVMANGKYFGAGMGIAPDAVPNDGQFSTVTIGDISLFDYIKNLGKIKKCLKVDHPALKYLNASAISVNAMAARLPVDMDGEFAGFTPLKLKMIPGAVNFLCPA